MTKQEFCDWAARNGWQKDSYGHFHKEGRRFKIQVNSVRLERSYQSTATEYCRSEKKWVKVRGVYFKDLSVNSEGKLVGLK